MVKIITGQNILSIKRGIICHQVNCQGVMGSGLARAIRHKYPLVYDLYLALCNNSTPDELLGGTQLCLADIKDNKPELFVANIFGQKYYGRENKVYTDYSAVDKAFKFLAKMKHPDLPVYVPNHIGCGLGGGNWMRYLEIVKTHIPNVTVCVL